MNTNVTKPISLQKLTYSDIVENLGHVCFGNYHLPENDDTCTTVNNEYGFDRWKSRLICRYPNARVVFDEKGSWSRKILVLDKTFEYDKELFVNIKQSILNESRYENSLH